MNLKGIMWGCLMAARMRKGELFTEWLKEAEEKLSLTLNQVEQDKAVDFIIALTFIVCDRSVCVTYR